MGCGIRFTYVKIVHCAERHCAMDISQGPSAHQLRQLSQVGGQAAQSIKRLVAQSGLTQPHRRELRGTQRRGGERVLSARSIGIKV